MPEEIVRNPDFCRGCALKMSVFPGLPKRNPGLELANAFSVTYFPTGFSKVGNIRLLVQSY
jgi:hypothetical protein